MRGFRRSSSAFCPCSSAFRPCSSPRAALPVTAPAAVRDKAAAGDLHLDAFCCVKRKIDPKRTKERGWGGVFSSSRSSFVDLQLRFLTTLFWLLERAKFLSLAPFLSFSLSLSPFSSRRRAVESVRATRQLSKANNREKSSPPLKHQKKTMSDDPDACPKPRLEEACKALCSKYVVAYQVRARSRRRERGRVLFF